MIVNRFYFVGLILVFFVLGGPERACADISDEEAMHILSPLINTAAQLGISVSAREHTHLRKVISPFIEAFPLASLDHIVTLGAQYLQNISTPLALGIEEVRSPSMMETSALLGKLCEIEQGYNDQPIEVTHFLYGLLETYFFEESTTSQHFYYLSLFEAIFENVSGDYDQTEFIISWVKPFMRIGHTEKQRTDIAVSIVDHIRHSLDEDLLRQALDDTSYWSDQEVASFLPQYLADGHTLSRDSVTYV